MKLDEAVERLNNVIICEKCHISGKECNDNCPTQYKAGTVGECVEAMETVLDFVKHNRGSEQERWLRGE